MRLNVLQLGYERVKFESMSRFKRQMSTEKRMQVCQYPFQSGIQRQGRKQYRERHSTWIKGVIHKDISTSRTFGAANSTAVRNASKLSALASAKHNHSAGMCNPSLLPDKGNI